MAIVTALRFTENCGAISVDQESWHIWRRKNWFSDHLYILVPEKLADQFGIELVYSGAGHPPFHYEVSQKASQRISAFLTSPDLDPQTVTVERLGKIVLEAFQEVHRRRVNDKLEYLYGFDLDGFNSGQFTMDGKTYEIQQKQVIERANKIVQGIENTGYPPFSLNVEGCLIGTDRIYGFSAFVLKEKDGVLSFQSCWFDSLGQGRDAATIGFSRLLNDRFLESRRKGEGLPQGLFYLLDAICEAMERYSQNGGFIRMVVLDGTGKDRQERINDIRDNSARLSLEIIRAFRAGIFTKSLTMDLLEELILRRQNPDIIENKLFRSAKDPTLLGKVLRGYKIGEGNLPQAGPERALFGLEIEAEKIQGEAQ